MMICQECGQQTGRYKSGSPKKFCGKDCRKVFNNRRAMRGAEMYDLFMELRNNRKVAGALGVWSFMCRMAQMWREEDERDRPGRRSWSSAQEVILRHPDVSATVVGVNVAGIKRRK